MEDPDKKILDWCGHLAVPRLVDEKAYSSCRGCSTKLGGFLSKQKTHHCRLCGHMYCSACTAKYHVPLIFRIKNKDGPTRVCMACVDGCMAEKAKAAQGGGGSNGAASGAGGPAYGASALSTSTVSASLLSMSRVVEIAPPDAWEDEAAFVQCPKCSAKKCKTHNCRVCGKCFCDKCTSKMEIPPYFEKKKGKTGPSRVCDSCRFKIVSSGAKLVEKLSPAALAAQQAANPQVKKTPPPPPPGFIGKDRRPSHSFANKCSNAGCLAPSAGTDGKCASHGGGGKDESHEIAATVKREGADGVVAKLTLPSGDTTLATIDVLLKKTAPQTEAYQFVFRGEPVPEAFYPVFLARHLGTTLFIRPKRRAHLAMDEPQLGELSSIAEDGSGGVSAVNNPFKSDPTLEAKRQAAREAAEAKANKKPLVFKKPTVTKEKLAIKVSSSVSGPPGVKKAPPPPPGAAAPTATTSASQAIAAGATVDDVCKQRAKKIFGQL